MKMESLQILNRSLFEKKRSICVVGNGGVSPEDEEHIRNSDCVIRFNNYATRQNITLTEDKNKCDVLFTTFDLHSMGVRPKAVVIGIPFPFHAERISNKLEAWYPYSDPYMVNPYLNMEMCKMLNIPSEGYKHPFPSIGFTCLWHIWRMRITNPIYICGFNWYFDWSTMLCQGKPLGITEFPKNWNHNYHNELRWMTEHLMPKQFITFSDSCKKILKYARTKINYGIPY